MVRITRNDAKFILAILCIFTRADIFTDFVLQMFNLPIIDNLASVAVIWEYFALILLMSFTAVIEYTTEQGRKFQFMKLVLTGITALSILVSEVFVFWTVVITPIEIIGKLVSIAIFVLLVMDLWLPKKQELDAYYDAYDDTDTTNTELIYYDQEVTSSGEVYTSEKTYSEHECTSSDEVYTSEHECTSSGEVYSSEQTYSEHECTSSDEEYTSEDPDEHHDYSD